MLPCWDGRKTVMRLTVGLADVFSPSLLALDSQIFTFLTVNMINIMSWMEKMDELGSQVVYSALFYERIRHDWTGLDSLKQCQCNGPDQLPCCCKSDARHLLLHHSAVHGLVVLPVLRFCGVHQEINADIKFFHSAALQFLYNRWKNPAGCDVWKSVIN